MIFCLSQHYKRNGEKEIAAGNKAISDNIWAFPFEQTWDRYTGFYAGQMIVVEHADDNNAKIINLNGEILTSQFGKSSNVSPEGNGIYLETTGQSDHYTYYGKMNIIWHEFIMDFSEEALALTKLPSSSNYGYVNQQNIVVYKKPYFAATNFYNGLAVIDASESTRAIIDEKLKLLNFLMVLRASLI